MNPFTWRRLAGTAIIAVPAFFLVIGAAEIATKLFRFRQDFAVQTAVLVLLGVICSAWVYGESIYASCANSAARLRRTPKWVRLVAAGTVGWTAAVLLFVWTFEPFGHYMDSRDWSMVGKIILFPWALGAIIFGLYRWARKI